MPSTSKSQENLMRAACKDPEFARKKGINQDVACEFMRADQKKERERDRKRKRGE